MSVPTTAEIADNIIAQLELTLSQTIPLLPKSFNRVLSKALAAVFVLLYKYGGFIFLQIFVQTASIAETIINGKTISPLIAWGRLIGVGDPTAATQAELLIDITVTNQVGSLPSGTQLLNTDNGVTYITVGDVLLDAAIVQATIRAVADESNGDGSGTIGNLNPTNVVSFADPLANVERDAIVDSQVTTGANGESTEVYRQRIIDRFQKRPQGGAYSDYEIWGEETAGIINVYPYTGSPGQVNVYSEATPESSGDPDGIPTGAQLDAVKASIEFDQAGLASRRPAGAFVNSLPITRTGFDVTVLGLVVDDTAQVQTDITSAIDDYFVAREPYIPGLSIPPRKDRITESALAGAVEDVVSAAGGIFEGVTLSLDASPIPIYTVGEGEKAKILTVSFV